MNGPLAQLLNGGFRMPDSAINYGNVPLPRIPPGAPQFVTPDDRINFSQQFLQGIQPYVYGNSARISTQTQMAHPNKVALIIPKLFIPAAESDGLDLSDPLLEHTLSDGDLTFSLRMSPDMTCYGSQYCIAPYGYTAKAVQLINLATVNYILWGLQVGMKRPKSTRWKRFFAKLNRKPIHDPNNLDTVWNFICTYLIPFGIMHGADTQGGQHEGDTDPLVTHGAVDYVSSFAIEGKLLHVNNIWRDYDVHDNDDLILALRRMEHPHPEINFNLSSSVRSHRSERAPISNSWFYLKPEVLEYRSFSDVPYIHIGRSQKHCSMYSRGINACCWDARMGVTPGAPLQMTFEPDFVDSDDIFYSKLELNDDKTRFNTMHNNVAMSNNNDNTNNNDGLAIATGHMLRLGTNSKKNRQDHDKNGADNKNNDDDNPPKKKTRKETVIEGKVSFGDMMKGN